MTTYNTGKVQIGLLYTPRMPEIYGDARRLQTALIDGRTANKPGAFARVLGAIWGWL